MERNQRNSLGSDLGEPLFVWGWLGGGGVVEKEGEERLASLKSPNPLTSVAGAKMEDHTAF